MLLSECDIGCYPDASEKSPSTASITTTFNAKTDNTLPTAVGCVDGRNANNLDTSLDDDDDDDNRIGWVRLCSVVLDALCVCVHALGWVNESLFFGLKSIRQALIYHQRQSIEIEANKQISENIIPLSNNVCLTSTPMESQICSFFSFNEEWNVLLTSKYNASEQNNRDRCIDFQNSIWI